MLFWLRQRSFFRGDENGHVILVRRFFFDFDKSIYHVVNLILDMNDSKGADKTGYILR